MINYFPYDYAPPQRPDAAVQHQHRGLPEPVVGRPQAGPHRHQGLFVQRARSGRAPTWSSWSTRRDRCSAPNKLPLVKQSLDMLLDQLAPTDTVAIVTYAGHAGTALEPTRSARSAGSEAVIDRARRRRQHGRRRRHPPGLSARRAELRPQGRQPRDPGDRRRFQRRHHRPRRAQGLCRARARARASSCRCSASAWAITTTR